MTKNIILLQFLLKSKMKGQKHTRTYLHEAAWKLLAIADAVITGCLQVGNLKGHSYSNTTFEN